VRPQFSALHATVQLYEASEGVPAGLKAMATPDRVPHTTPHVSCSSYRKKVVIPFFKAMTTFSKTILTYLQQIHLK
jgi:hypothetical protein